MEVVAIARLSDNAFVDNVLVAAALVTALATVGALIWKAIKPFKVRIDEFLDWHDSFRPQWEGYHGSGPGDIESPGVMERLSRIDGQFQRNGGNSLKDAVVKLTHEVESVSACLEDIRQDMRALSEHLHDDRGGT